MSMHDTVRAFPVLALAGLLAAALAAPGLAGEPPSDEPVDWAARAEHTWLHSCQTCHAAPDARIETDRAFLAQIPETT